jgi:hypothetical protein
LSATNLSTGLKSSTALETHALAEGGVLLTHGALFQKPTLDMRTQGFVAQNFLLKGLCFNDRANVAMRMTDLHRSNKKHRKVMPPYHINPCYFC